MFHGIIAPFISLTILISVCFNVLFSLLHCLGFLRILFLSYKRPESLMAFVKCLLILPLCYIQECEFHPRPHFLPHLYTCLTSIWCFSCWVSPTFLYINQLDSWLHPRQALDTLWSTKSFAICLTALWLPKFLFAVTYRFMPFISSFSDISLHRDTDKYICSMSFSTRSLLICFSNPESLKICFPKHYLKPFLSQSLLYLHPVYIICSLWSMEQCFSSGVRRNGDIKRKKKIHLRSPHTRGY